jgi:hypothetical protein
LWILHFDGEMVVVNSLATIAIIFAFVILWFLSLCFLSSLLESKNSPQTLHLEIILVISIYSSISSSSLPLRGVGGLAIEHLSRKVPLGCYIYEGGTRCIVSTSLGSLTSTEWIITELF